MNNKVDKLFKDKLENHSLQPSAQAWEKVEAHLGKKNKMVLWRVAAAIVLLGVLTFVGLRWNDEPEQQIVKKTVDSGRETVDGKKETDEDLRQEAEVKQEITPVTNEIKKEAPKKIIKKKTTEPVAPVIDAEETVGQQVAIIEQPVIETPGTQQQVTATQKGITLTYSLPSIKKDEPVIAEVPKKTGLERVLEIAKEVKNADSPLAELREAKNDILAFEFRKDKNKKH